MKVGDTVAVSIQGHHVTNAEVVDVNTKENIVELVVPATRVVMGLQTSLAAPSVPEPAREVIIDGVIKPDQPVEQKEETHEQGITGTVSATPSNESVESGVHGNGPEQSERPQTDNSTEQTNNGPEQQAETA